MNAKTLAAIAAALLIGIPAANAIPAAWLIQGEIDIVEGDLPPAIGVGNPFSFVVHFDTDTPVFNPIACAAGGPGTTCRHNGDPTMYFSDIVIDGNPYGNFNPNPPGNSSIIVRNNALVGIDTVDGYSFSSSEIHDLGAKVSTFLVIFRGPEDLDVVTDGRILPTSPPIGLLTLGTHLFQYCNGTADQSGFSQDCDDQFLEGNITSVAAVPEPGTLALLGLGLAGLGLGRRRASR